MGWWLQPGRNFQTRHAEMHHPCLQRELFSMSSFGISQTDTLAEGASHLHNGHPKTFLSRAGDPWESALAVLRDLLNKPRLKFPPHPAPMHQAASPQHNSSQGLPQHPGSPKPAPSSPKNVYPAVLHLFHNVHQESGLLLDSSSSSSGTGKQQKLLQTHL